MPTFLVQDRNVLLTIIETLNDETIAHALLTPSFFCRA